MSQALVGSLLAEQWGYTGYLRWLKGGFPFGVLPGSLGKDGVAGRPAESRAGADGLGKGVDADDAALAVLTAYYFLQSGEYHRSEQERSAALPNKTESDAEFLVLDDDDVKLDGEGIDGALPFERDGASGRVLAHRDC
jgi:hypothetical protein